MNKELNYPIKPLTYNDLCNTPGIKKLKEKPLRGIYFLILNKTVVYVGQSNNIAVRSHTHKDKKFNHILYIESDKNSLNNLEAHYIIAFHPEYNKTHQDEILVNLYLSKGDDKKKIQKYINKINKEEMNILTKKLLL